MLAHPARAALADADRRKRAAVGAEEEEGAARPVGAELSAQAQSEGPDEEEEEEAAAAGLVGEAVQDAQCAAR